MLNGADSVVSLRPEITRKSRIIFGVSMNDDSKKEMFDALKEIRHEGEIYQANVNYENQGIKLVKLR